MTSNFCLCCVHVTPVLSILENDYFRTCIVSQIIDLNDNTITEEGSVALAEVLPNVQNLKVLNLGDCLVRDNGAKAIAGAIKNGHRQLQVG